MDEPIYVQPCDIEIIDAEYSTDLTEHFDSLPDMTRPLLHSAQKSLKKIEQMLYSAPSFVNAVKALVPKEALQAVFTDEQKAQLTRGAVELMTKKDGSLLATLVDPKTKKIVSKISLEKVKLSPEMSQAMTSYAGQMQMAQIAEQIQTVQNAIEDVRQGQEYDRLATAYSCQQKLLQAMTIKNPELKAMALLRIVSDAEDSRNLLMQSQSANIAFIREQPESFWGKILTGASPEKIDSRMAELRESLCAVNMVSLAEAMAYQEMGETEAAQVSLQYYAGYLDQAYLRTPGFVERLDMIDPAPESYWSKTLPDIKEKIQTLPCNLAVAKLEENADGAKALQE